MRTLDEVIADYERAETTLVWEHERSQDLHTIAFAVVEMCPAEQAPSPIIGGQRGLSRTTLDKNRTLYAKRWFTSPSEALTFFRGPVRRLQSGGGVLTFRAAGALADEPPNEIPVVLEESHSFRNVLPTRHAGLRVVSKLGPGQSALATFMRDVDDESAVARFLSEWCGADVFAFEEHFGSVHLLLPNALVRAVSQRNAPEIPGIRTQLHLRAGASLDGCTLRLTDHRPQGLGFELALAAAPHALIKLPCDVEELETKLINRHGEVVFHRQAVFLRQIKMNVQMNQPAERVVTDRRDPTIQHRIAVHGVGHAVESVIGEAPLAAGPQLLRAAEQERRRRAPDDSVRVFARANEKEARAYVRDMIAKAKTRCFICDPYLGPGDVYDYAVFARTIHVPIELLGSLEFAKKAADRPINATYAMNVPFTPDVTNGERLSDEIASLVKQDATLAIRCRLLRGGRSPIHDRFIVIDEKAHALGSSLNEFGSRLTTCITLPDATPLLSVLNEHWNSDELSVALDEWVVERPSVRATHEQNVRPRRLWLSTR